jgi:hypothetical protein
MKASFYLEPIFETLLEHRLRHGLHTLFDVSQYVVI